MAHAVKVSRVDQKEQTNSISNIESQNPSLKSRVKILHVSWHLKTLKSGKTHGPLFIEEGTPGEAIILVQEGLLHDGELKDCELFIEDCTLTQCYKCYHFGHTAKTSKGRRNCGHCANEHNSRSCPTSKNPNTYSCCTCKGKHTAWSRLRPVRAAQASRAGAAYAARPSLYKIPAKSSPNLSCPTPLSPPPSQPPALQTQPTPSQAVGLVQNPAPINGKRARANSNSHAQSNSKKTCASSSSSTSLVLYSTSPTSTQPTPPPPSQIDPRSRLRPGFLCIMMASNVAPPESPQL